jgi:hypothetical protein
MKKAKILLDRILDISERYRVELKVFEVDPNEKYPEGIKARFVLVDVVKKVPRLVIDNHAPFGFHLHNGLPEEKERRITLNISDYLQALDKFRDLVKEILDNEI